MIKQSVTAIAIGLGMMMTGQASAATGSGQFNVNVSLTSKCEIFNGSGATGTIGDIALNYTSFQTSASTSSTNFNVRCTNTLPYSMSLDQASVTDGTTGLAYTLNLNTSSTHNATANDTLGSQTGNGNTGRTYYIHANIAANQDGTSTAGTANNQRTLTITY